MTTFEYCIGSTLKFGRLLEWVSTFVFTEGAILDKNSVASAFPCGWIYTLNLSSALSLENWVMLGFFQTISRACNRFGQELKTLEVVRPIKL